MIDPFSDRRWQELVVLARATGAKPGQIAKWKERRKVPGDWAIRLFMASRSLGFIVTPKELELLANVEPEEAS